MRDVIRTGILCVFALAATPAVADINWTYLQAGFERTDIDVGGGGVDGNGFRLEGSYGINENVYAFGSYSSSDIDVGSFDVDFDVLIVGVGMHSNTSSTMQYFGQIGLVDFDSTGGSEDGIAVAAGVRKAFNEQFQGKAALEYFDPLEDSELGLLLEGLYAFDEQFAATVDLRLSDDINRLGVSFRMRF